MDVTAVDRSATQGASWIHRASATGKLIAFALLICAVVVTWNVFVVAAIVLLVVAAAISGNLDLRLTFGLAAYPAVFAVVFALASAPDAVTGTTIVLKAVAAGLAAVVLALTTPYPQIFAPVQRVVPTLVGDALLMTYRTSFLLLDKLSSLSRAIRLRSGVRRAGGVTGATATAHALGGVVLYSLDLSQRDYDVLRMRGYSGRIRARLPASRDRGADALLLLGAGLALGTAVLWRAEWRTLNPYSWLPVLPALAAILVALVVRWRSA